MGVIGYSDSFSGEVSRDDLRHHIFTHRDRPDDLVYHCDLYYKLGERDWGFSLPLRLADSLESGTYEVDLKTRFEPGTTKVLEYHLAGESDQTIVINAHNCHTAQANDDLSGVVAGVEIMRRLSARTDRRYSYRLIVAPEHYGTVFYLASLDQSDVQRLKSGMFLEGVGNNNRLALQSSFNGNAEIDRAADLVLRHIEPGYERTEMRGIMGNDETVWEAPGYEIPTISLTRFPYPEYHSSADTPEIVTEQALSGTVDAILQIFDVLEKNIVMHRKFTGLVALSNPKYDLYISPGTDPSAPSQPEPDRASWNRLMDRLPRYFDGETTVLDVAEEFDLPFGSVREYVGKFHEKGLIEIEPA
jgi:aminopeptidase-like protein